MLSKVFGDLILTSGLLIEKTPFTKQMALAYGEQLGPMPAQTPDPSLRLRRIGGSAKDLQPIFLQGQGFFRQTAGLALDRGAAFRNGSRHRGVVIAHFLETRQLLLNLLQFSTAA